MKKKSISMLVLVVVYMIAASAVSAQITIFIPELSKIKKTKTEQTITVENKQTNQSSELKSSSQYSTTDDDMDFRLSMFLDDIAKAQEEVDEYTPETKIYLLQGKYYEWLVRAVSMRARNEFYEKWKSLLTTSSRTKFESALEKLKSSAAQKLPLYKANPKAYNFRNPAEEKMMKGSLDNFASLKMFKIGLNQSNWLIDKNNLGIPRARYKHGMIWARDPNADHPYCYIYYINIIQDYAGGGTYGASYANYIERQLAGCPVVQ